MIKVAPSILSADFANLGPEVASLSGTGCDIVHIDIMDGHFVPNLTIGPGVVKAIRKYSELFFDVHLMISDPMKYADDFIAAGADGITVHAETLGDKLPEAIAALKQKGVKAAVSLNPDTPVSAIESVLDDVDMVLIMTVWPGFGGQKLIESALLKVKELRTLRPQLDIEVDGGVNEETLSAVLDAGANVLVMGSAYFKSNDKAALVKKVHTVQPGGEQ